MRVVSVDTETFRFGPARMAPPLVCSSVATVGEMTEEALKAWGVERALHPPSVWDSIGVELRHVYDGPEWIEDLFAQAARGEIVLVGHNFAYDVAVYLAQWPHLIPTVFAAYEAGQVSDTMIRQKLLDIANGCYRGWKNAATGKWTKHGYTLGDLSVRHLSKALDKSSPWRTRYDELVDKPLAEWPGDAISYAMEDGQATEGVWLAQQDAAANGVLVDEPRQVRAALALHLAGVWGIRTDAAGVEALREGAQGDVDRLRDLLITAGLLRRNGSRRMKLAKERMLAVNPHGKKTPTGGPALDETSCAESGDPVLIALSEYGRAQNLLAKDVRALEKGTTLPIHTYFDSLMETGRTSSSGAYNLQNPRRKRGVRECFVPRPGTVFAACDFDKAELHTLAQVCLSVLGHSQLAEALNNNADPHLMLGAQVINIPYEEAVRRKKDPEVKATRQGAKPINFGLPGGMGVNGLQTYARAAYGVDFTEEEIKSWIKTYHETWPEMQEYFAWVRNLCGRVGVASITHLFSGRHRGHIPYTVTCNSFFQGLCADGAKAALWAVCHKQYNNPSSALYGTRTVNFIHDELLLEVPEETAHEAAMELQATMVEAFNPWVPDVPIRASAALMRRWSKSAEPVWQNGQLVPYE